jgi:hypothetical protein
MITKHLSMLVPSTNLTLKINANKKALFMSMGRRTILAVVWKGEQFSRCYGKKNNSCCCGKKNNNCRYFGE